MDWTTAPVVALMIFTVSPQGEVIDGVHYANKPYITCMVQADSMRAKRIDPHKLPACIRVDAAKQFMENKPNVSPKHHAQPAANVPAR